MTSHSKHTSSRLIQQKLRCVIPTGRNNGSNIAIRWVYSVNNVSRTVEASVYSLWRLVSRHWINNSDHKGASRTQPCCNGGHLSYVTFIIMPNVMRHRQPCRRLWWRHADAKTQRPSIQRLTANRGYQCYTTRQSSPHSSRDVSKSYGIQVILWCADVGRRVLIFTDRRGRWGTGTKPRGQQSQRCVSVRDGAVTWPSGSLTSWPELTEGSVKGIVSRIPAPKRQCWSLGQTARGGTGPGGATGR